MPHGACSLLSVLSQALHKQGYIRVDDSDTTLEAIVEGALSSSSGKNLCLDHRVLSTCKFLVPTSPARSNPKPTNLFGNLFCFRCVRRDAALGNANAILIRLLAHVLPLPAIPRFVPIQAGWQTCIRVSIALCSAGQPKVLMMSSARR